MSLIDDLSIQTPLPSLDLFGVPPTQTSVERDIVREVRPLSTISSLNPIEFIIQTVNDEYVNLYETYFYLTFNVNITKNDKTSVKTEDWSDIIPVNNLLHSMFEQVEVTIGDYQVNSSLGTYAYRSYLDTLLNFHTSARQSQLTSCGWLESEQERRNLILPHGEEKSRGKELTLCGKLHLDLTYQERLILGGTQLKIKLIPHKSEFYIISKKANLIPSVTFHEAFLEVHIAKVYQAISLAHDQALLVSAAKYPVNRKEVKQFTIPKGSLDAFIDNAFVGTLPRRVFLVMVNNEAYHGKAQKDPFYFDHFKVNYLACYHNSQQYPSKAYKPSFEKYKWTREFIGLFKAADQTCYESKIPITYEEYGYKGKTIFGFNFAPDLSNDCVTVGRANLIKKGTLRFELHFSQALSETINVLVFAEFDSIIQVNTDRNALTDFV